MNNINKKIVAQHNITLKSGISLITLIITIIVIIILTSVILISLNQSSIMANAKDAVIENNFSTIQEEIEYYKLNKYYSDHTTLDLYPLEKDEDGNYITMDNLPEETKNNLPMELKMNLYDTEKHELETYNNLPDISYLDYKKFYKIDTSLLTTAGAYGQDLYIYIYDLKYVVFNISGIKYKGNTEYSIIPLGGGGSPEYIALTNNTFRLDTDGNLKVLGQINSITGETSDEYKKYSGIREFTIPSVIENPSEVKKVYFSLGTAYVIDKDDNLWAWGNNPYNKLGLGNSFTITVPNKINENIKVNNESIKVKNVWAGVSNTWIVDTENRVWACGSNTSGSFGIGNTNYYSGYIRVDNLDGSKVKEIMPNLSDSRYTFVLYDDGRVFASGSNTYGIFGKNNTTSIKTFEELTSFYGAKKILAGGNRTTFILKDNGELYGVGSNVFGGLGLPISDNTLYTIPVKIAYNVSDISYVEYWRGSVRYKTVDGDIYQSGVLKYDNLGAPLYDQYFRMINNINDVDLSFDSNELLISKGKLYTVLYNSQDDQLTATEYSTSYSNVSSTESFYGMKIFKASGKLYLDSYPDITAAGSRVRLTLKNVFTGAKFVQGATNNISIVDKNSNIWESLTNKNTQLSNVKKIISSNTAKFALLKNGELYAKGASTTGGWGDALVKTSYTLITKDGTTPFSVKDVYTSVYGNSAIFLTNDNELYWFGHDAHIYLPNKENGDILYNDGNYVTKYPHKINTLGLDTNVLTNIADIVYDVNWSDFYSRITYVLTNSGELYVTGDSSKTTGLGSTSTKFTKITAFGNAKVKSIKSYQGCTIALLEDGKVYAWGYNTYGQFGGGYVIGNTYTTPQRLNISTNIIKITLGDGFALFLANDGTVYGSGRNEYGQLGNGTNVSIEGFTECKELE